MAFTKWHPAHRVVVAVVAVATGGLACSDTTTPTKKLDAALTEPRRTAAVDFTATVLGRGNLGTFSSQPQHGYDVQINARDNTDIVTANIEIGPGGSSGWHSHPGPVLVVVKSGTVTFYEGNDPTCSPTVHPAGTSFIEQGGDVAMARNEGELHFTAVATFFVPAGSPTRLDAPNPGNCPF
jgi:quercetin dioxygenase-like cupin family protein